MYKKLYESNLIEITLIKNTIIRKNPLTMHIYKKNVSDQALLINYNKEIIIFFFKRTNLIKFDLLKLKKLILRSLKTLTCLSKKRNNFMILH